MSRLLLVKSRDHLKNIVTFTNVLMEYHYASSQYHVDHVRSFTQFLCLRYNQDHPDKAIPEADLSLIYEGASLHDIGLISIPDEYLEKKGKLTQEEIDLFRTHTTASAKVVEKMAGIYRLSRHESTILQNICKYHHERYDGNGYPEGLKGEEIPVEAQIVSLAEVYAGLIRGNYSKSRNHAEAMKMILDGECGVFNPILVECAVKCSKDFQMLLECKDNQERVRLLQNTYGRSKKSYWKVKRTIDIIVSLFALVILSPLLLLTCALIYIDDPHASPIFKQTRVGRHKKEFTMYKLRTMYKDAEARKKELMAQNEKDGPVFKIGDDPRITRIGKWLRKTGLDELPQLFNILKGDMTLVGPRPPLPEEVEQYNRYTDMRLSVTPGLTCIWQVQPERDDIPFDQWMDMDIAYIGKRSVKDDIVLLFKTALTVFKKSGS